MPSPARGSADILDDDLYGSTEEVVEAPRPKRTSAAVEKKAAPPAKSKTPLLAAAAAVLVVALVGGWFAYSKFFGAPKYDPARTEAAFSESQSLAKSGNYDQAIAALLGIPTDDPQHDKALELIADLKKKKTEAAEMVDGRPAGVVYNESLANGQEAYLAHDYLGAKAAFEKAASIRPLPADVKTMYDAAAQQVGKLDSALNHYREGKYDLAIAALEPLLLEDPENKSVKQLLVNSHFNTGATALREDREKDAVSEFETVLQYDPNDELAKRSRDIAVRYSGQPKDLLYRIYVKHLPVRR
jgi:tetratricopeptide (TPR) repeat protein